MAAKIACVLLLCLAATCVTAAPRVKRTDQDSVAKRGTCISFCGANGVHCPSGYECHSNGCGHQCYRGDDYSQPEGCPLYKCARNCELGYKKDKNGCETCDCDYSLLAQDTLGK